MSLQSQKNNKAQPQYSTLNLFLRSALFLLSSVTLTVLYSFFCLFAFAMSLSTRHILIRFYLQAQLFLLEKICRVHYYVEGLEHISKNRGGIIMSKHQSTWEAFYLPTIINQPAAIIKRELLWVPFFGWGLATSSPISIDRSNRKKAMQQILQKGKIALDAGRWILIFPEGTRIPYGHVGHYRLGGARLAAETGYPIVPVAHNAGLFWPRREFIKRPGTIHVVIGPPIDPTGRDTETLLALTKDWIEREVTRINSLVNKSAS